MAKRTRRPSAPVKPGVPASSPCPCGLPATYGACCARFHTGSAAPATAESLMRSRYSAFAVRDEPYLLRTWAAATRPTALGLDPAVRWTGLDVLAGTDGTAFHTTGTVTFAAHYTDRGGPGTLRERSTFAREQGRWVYVDGDVQG
ncbi:YchJ family protein [Streptomyces sp. NRRL F-5126]|uniref:YchJ family protein n=1 Tax=Streptomyces sp. NRRL F-5126 TaxID=1463857 RepID=UPI0004CC10EE|nr:YchJ family metal-binding protein [Streptomyces sp. NRRL F-5126]